LVALLLRRREGRVAVWLLSLGREIGPRRLLAAVHAGMSGGREVHTGRRTLTVGWWSTRRTEAALLRRKRRGLGRSAVHPLRGAARIGWRDGGRVHEARAESAFDQWDGIEFISKG
jgi:hypothetical protein